jgi:glycosyltransferase involved in cell wall biosynthesis
MRIHLVGLPHRDPVRAWEPCAYTGKLVRLAEMLTGLGHEVYLYAGPDNDATVTEHVTVVTADDRRRWWGDETWEDTVFDQFDPTSAPWLVMNSRTVVAMAERIEAHDIIFLTMGRAQAAIQQAFPNHVVAECGVGYEGVLADTPRCFESSAWMHYVWGKTGVADGRFFDTVIPNGYDPADYLFRTEPGTYLLYLGRLAARKGLEVVAELAKHHHVITAGPGDPIPGVEHLGLVRGAMKAALIAGARAVLCPTIYIEPFGGVAVEAMLSGVPVITSPFGAFSETVAHGVSGYRCSTLTEFHHAADAVDDLDPKQIREWAMDRYTLGAVAPQYDRWVARLATLYDRGWYQ